MSRQAMSLQAQRLARMSRAQGQSANTVNLPAPIGGWNARDSIADMQPTDAVTLQNWFPTTSDVMVRAGYTQWSTGLPSQVNTLLPYNPGSGLPKLFAASGTGIYDVTNGGAVGSPSVFGLTSSKWSYTNFATNAGTFLLAVNGVDGYYIYNGTTWESITSSSSGISITGVDPTTLSFVDSYASFVWFIQSGSLNAYYLPVGQVGGAASVFPLQAIFRRGGSLVSMGIWTVDGGYGMQDYLCFVTSEGEIAIYGGTNPAQASSFSLVGVYQVGTPLGFRCFMKYGGDLVYIGRDGLGPISRLLASSRVNTQVDLTAKIQGAIAQAAALYGSDYGWCITLFPLENMLLLNVPVGPGLQQQYVMNTITGAWCNFTGWAANHIERYRDNIYFGGNGFVGLAWQGFSDNGAAIPASAQQAFSRFGVNEQKRFTMMRPIMWVGGAATIAANLNVDYDQNLPQTPIAFVSTNQATWDGSLWDSGQWGGLSIAKAWQGVAGIGMAASPILSAAINGVETHWVSSDIVFERGWTI